MHLPKPHVQPHMVCATAHYPELANCQIFTIKNPIINTQRSMIFLMEVFKYFDTPRKIKITTKWPSEVNGGKQ